MEYKSYKNWLLHHLLRHKFILISVILSVILLTLTKSFIPIIIGGIIDTVILIKPFSQIISLLIIVLILYLSSISLDYLSMMVGHYLGLKTEQNMRKEFFDIIQSKPLEYHDEKQSGDLQALATYDLRIVNSMVSHGTFYIYPFIQVGITGFLLVDLLDFRLGILFFPFLIVYIYTILLYRRKISPFVSARMKKHSNISVVLQENIIGASVVKSFNNTDNERKKFYNAVKEFRNNWIGENLVQAKYYPLLAVYLAIGIIFLVGIIFVYQGTLRIGTLVSINLLIIALTNPTNTIHWATRDMMSGFAACSRVFSALSTKSKQQKNQETQKQINQLKGKIEFNNVSFAYGDSNENSPIILKNINFTINPNQQIALVGPTGCGKSTLVKLILCLYKPLKGKILLDGIDITKYSTETLRKHIGYVEQDTYLFPRSVSENITFGKPDASPEKVLRVAKMAQVHEFAKDLPNGYDTIVGERGTRLSGGEKQRISIARALLTDPEIIILDDSVSAVDSETEEKIGKAINNLLSNRTTIIITHRLHTIKSSDKIIVLKDGSIVSQGTHSELIEESEDYRRIFRKKRELPKIESQEVKRLK